MVPLGTLLLVKVVVPIGGSRLPQGVGSQKQVDVVTSMMTSEGAEAKS